MNRRPAIPGASYVDAFPTGEYVALIVGSHFTTHQGRVELPPGEPWGLLFVRASLVGGFHFAGKGHDSGLVWEWRDGTWTSFAEATGRGCYDAGGEYRDALPAGLQFCADDGSLVSRIESYGTVEGLNEWTVRGGLRIGQGHDGGGVRVFADGALRELEPGYCIFITANRDGEHVTVACWREDANCAVIWDATLAELRALPPVAVPSDPPPITQPKPEPIPMPADNMPINQFSTVVRVRDKYPTPLGSQAGAFLAELIDAIHANGDTDAGLLRDAGGPSGVTVRGVAVERDIVCWPDGTQYDVLGDSENVAAPRWGEVEFYAKDPSRYVRIGAAPIPQPDPEPQPVPDGALAARIAVLEADVAKLKAWTRGVA